MTLDEVKGLGERIAGEIGKAVVGQEQTVRHLLIALFSGGHVLLEGPPGTAKTFLAQCFAATVGLDFKRIQFTPDLMPGDITGSNIFNFQTSQFSLTRGPIFCDLLLSDEINRAPPKTQAALLEAMQERSVTLDGVSHPLGDRFMVVATQNPIENQGVYPLPEAQLDRFLFKLLVDYPDEAEEIRIVATHGADRGTTTPQRWGIARQTDGAVLAEAVAAVSTVTLVDEVVAYIVRLIRATRTSIELTAGASPRAAAMLAGAARASAALDGRDYVVPDDVRALAPAVLRHRIALSPTAEIDGRKPEEVVATLIAEVEAPR
jgi:MoxR-like ATPase